MKQVKKIRLPILITAVVCICIMALGTKNNLPKEPQNVTIIKTFQISGPYEHRYMNVHTIVPGRHTNPIHFKILK